MTRVGKVIRTRKSADYSTSRSRGEGNALTSSIPNDPIRRSSTGWQVSVADVFRASWSPFALTENSPSLNRLRKPRDAGLVAERCSSVRERPSSSGVRITHVAPTWRTRRRPRVRIAQFPWKRSSTAKIASISGGVPIIRHANGRGTCKSNLELEFTDCSRLFPTTRPVPFFKWAPFK